MKHLTIPAVLVAAFLATGCAETQQVCRRYGNQEICRTERVPTAAERDSRLNHAMYTIDWMDCVELGQGTQDYCKSWAKAKNSTKYK